MPCAEAVVGSHGQRNRWIDPGKLLDDNDSLEVGEPGAAKFLRPCHPHEPEPAQCVDDFPGKFLRLVELHHDGAHLLLCKIPGNILHRFLPRCQAGIHVPSMVMEVLKKLAGRFVGCGVQLHDTARPLVEERFPLRCPKVHPELIRHQSAYPALNTGGPFHCKAA